MALVSESMDTLEEILKMLEGSCSGFGLTISCSKTKILVICPSNFLGGQPREIQLRPKDKPIAVVEKFESLGSTISQDCTLENKVSMHIRKASCTFGSLYWVLWSRKRLKIATKVRLFNSIVISTLLYGRETWVPQAMHLKCIQGFIMGCVWVIAC